MFERITVLFSFDDKEASLKLTPLNIFTPVGGWGWFEYLFVRVHQIQQTYV